MSGVDLTDRGLVVDREPNRLDELALEFSRVLSRPDIDHAFVAGYVAILAGRSRSTEDVDVFIERCSSERIDDLVAELEREGYWDRRCRSRTRTGTSPAGRTAGSRRTAK